MKCTILKKGITIITFMIFVLPLIESYVVTWKVLRYETVY